jgi:thioredoxin-like negative regulator of GroEL
MSKLHNKKALKKRAPTKRPDLHVLFFSADWCGPCKPFSKFLKKQTDVGITKIDIDKDPDTTSKYLIRAVPTLVALDKDLNCVGAVSGELSREQFNDWIEKIK